MSVCDDPLTQSVFLLLQYVLLISALTQHQLRHHNILHRLKTFIHCSMRFVHALLYSLGNQLFYWAHASFHTDNIQPVSDLTTTNVFSYLSVS